MGKARLVQALGPNVLGIVISILIAPGLALAAGDANEAQCEAATEASPGYRSYLPDCRAYELVTPPYKEGGIVLDEPGAVSASGSRVILGAGGAFSGAGNYWYNPGRNHDGDVYEFVRGTNGWQSSPLTPPANEYSHGVLMAVSAADFQTTLWGAQETGVPYQEDIYLRTGPEASQFNFVGPGTPRNEHGEVIPGHAERGPTEELKLVGASRDLSHSLFRVESSTRLGASDVWQGDTTESNKDSLYEYVYTGSKDSEPVLVGVKNQGLLHSSPHVNEGAELISDCGTALGSSATAEAGAGSGSGSTYNAVSSTGEVVFFTASACPSQGPKVDELYARLDGEHTLAISEPVLPGGAAGECASSEPCHGAASAPAVFQGASEDGRRVFFLSEQPLVNGAPAEGMKLYEERLEGDQPSTVKVAEVIDVSNNGLPFVNPEVQGVVRVSENGERVYFVAQGKLTGSDQVVGREPETVEPLAGADNLYVYEPETGNGSVYRTEFVASLLTPGEAATLATAETEEERVINEQGEKAFRFEFERVKIEFEPAENKIIEEFVNEKISIERALELLTEIELGPRKVAEEAVREKERAFVRDTVGMRGPSGTLAEDRRVWQADDERPAQTTPDGEVLAFLSSARLTPQDTSSVPQLFAYNAGDGSLTRVSIGQAGSASGNVDTFHDAPSIPEPPFSFADLPTAANTGLALSENGSRIFFESAADLVPPAENQAKNVYEYSRGGVDLISAGGDASTVNGQPTVTLLGADLSGQDAFFLTQDKLVPQYADTQVALYDARENGGFPAPVLEPGCLGETCRGPSGVTPVYQSPGSAGQAGDGNVSPVVPVPKHTTKKTTRCVKGKKLSRGKCIKIRGKKKTNAKKVGNDRRVKP
jgi:hypothetical protein